MAEFGIHPYYTAPSPAADLVLVHGLMGSSAGTWMGKDKAGKSTFWPDWIKAQCPSVNIWLVDYDSSLNAWIQPAMPLDSIAGAVLSHAKDQGLGQRPVHWVGHSMGGLIIKHLLRQAREKANPDWQRMSDATAAITFLGTPHHGSAVANWESYFSALLSAADVLLGTGGAATGVLSTFKRFLTGGSGDRKSHVEQLRAHSRELGSLNDSFAQWLGSADRRGSLRAVRNYYEELPAYTAVYVVPKHAAQLANALVEEVGVQANHFDICKFASERSPVFLGLLQVTRKVFGATSGATPVVPKPSSPPAAAARGVADTSSPEGNLSLARGPKPTHEGKDRTDLAWRNALKACDATVLTHAAKQLGRALLDADVSVGVGVDDLEASIASALSQGEHWAKIGSLKSLIQEEPLPKAWSQEQIERLTSLQAMLMVRLCALAYADVVKVADEHGLCLPDDRNQLAVAVASHVISGHGVEISLGADGLRVTNLIDPAALVDESAQPPGQQRTQTPLEKEVKAWFRRALGGSVTEQGRQFMSGYLSRSRDMARPLLIDRDGGLITPAVCAEARSLGMGVVQVGSPDRPSALDQSQWSDLCQALAFDLAHLGAQPSALPQGAPNAMPTSQQQEQRIQVNLNQSFTGPVGQSNVTTGANSPIHAQYVPAAAASPSSTMPLTLAFAKLEALLSDTHEKDVLHEFRDLVMERETSNSAQRRLPRLVADLQRSAQGQAEVTAAWSQLQTLMEAHWPELQSLMR